MLTLEALLWEVRRWLPRLPEFLWSKDSTDPCVCVTAPQAKQPAIYGPSIIGATPGKPFLFLVPAIGQEPLSFTAQNLPEGLSLNNATGIVSGTLTKPGTTVVEFAVTSPAGQSRRNLSIVGGQDRLALTPPMGWNSWNVWGPDIDVHKIKQAADWLVTTGLAAHGYQYVIIDDGWASGRNDSGQLVPKAKIGSIQALADYVHSKGLKLGLYSSPGPKTCLGLEGSYGHESQDAETFAQWGVDYLKYDLCSYKQLLKERTAHELRAPYELMGKALRQTSRDIVYAICEYGWANVWEWGALVGANSWRTTNDIKDCWLLVSHIAFGANKYAAWGRPGHWNDLDMMVVGRLGKGWLFPLHNTLLKRDEQVTHMTMWCLQASPIILGCDLARLDSFTLDLMTNDEVLAVDQDTLGCPAIQISKQGLLEVWARPLADGSLACGLFNRSERTKQVALTWQDAGLSGPKAIRDLWQRKDLGTFDQQFSATVPPHGTVLLKVTASQEHSPA